MIWLTHIYGAISGLSIIVSIYLSKSNEEISLKSIGFLSGWLLFLLSTILLLYILHHSWKNEEKTSKIKSDHQKEIGNLRLNHEKNIKELENKVKELTDNLKYKEFEKEDLKHRLERAIEATNILITNKTDIGITSTKRNPNLKRKTWTPRI